MKASLLVTLLGLGFALPQIYGLVQPARFGEALRRFPRSELWGYLLMPLGTVWFLYNLRQDQIADFAAFKPVLFVGFAVVGLGACLFVRDFLAVRGLAVVVLLTAHFTLNAIRWVDTPWRLVVTTWAYVWIVAAIWYSISPWRLRDVIGWMTRDDQRIRLTCAARLVFGLLVAGIGLTAIRAAE
ncbi:MAG: hypothetical protein M5U12_32550 [Verrucomicrobia bacterium]|nr:hypothetical protein [Verrucomicrobiota bacterium]